jgi:hypothetical protein
MARDRGKTVFPVTVAPICEDDRDSGRSTVEAASAIMRLSGD